MNIFESARTLCNKVIFQTKKHSPEILTGGAILFGVGTVVATWIAARKTDKALEKPKAVIKEAKAKEITEDYTEKDQKREIRHGYFMGASEIIKLYGPAALMGAFSITCVLGSYRILSARNAGLVMANSILTKEFNDYRENVIKKYGKEEDRHLRFDDKMEEVEKKVTDENGEEKTVTEKKPKDGYEQSDFARCFDESNPLWKKNTLYNLSVLRQIRDTLNMQLRQKGVLSMADAMMALKWEPTQASFQWGWVLKNGTFPQTCVDFGIPLDDPVWINEMEREGQRYFWLEFNCEKIIWSDLPFEEV